MKKFISDFMKYSTGAKIALAAAAVLTFLLGIFAGNAIQSGRASAALARMGKAETQFNLELSRRNDDLRRLADTLAERQIELDGLNGLKLTIDSETDLPLEDGADAPAPDEGQDEDAPAPAPVSTPDPSTSIRSGGWVKVFLLLFIAVVILATLIYIIVIIAGGRKKEEYDDDDDYDDEEEDYEDDDDYDEEEFDGDTDEDYDDEEDPDDDE